MKALLLVLAVATAITISSACQEGEISANENTCSSYYVCCSGELKEEFCNEGYYFNSQTTKCEKDTNNICWFECEDGEISVNDNTCSSYFVCCSGVLKEEFCNEGYYFNSQKRKCEEDINNVCWSQCNEGDITANDNTCSSYYVCCNGVLKEEFCNAGDYFNSQTNQCEEDIHKVCWTTCRDGEISGSNTSCSSYYSCNNGNWKEEFCSEGYYFNSQAKQCEEDINKVCWTSCQEGEIRESNTSCSLYYSCNNGNWKEEYCSVGYYFNPTTKQCEEDINNSCWPKCQEGETSANAYSCSSYFKCSNGALEEEFCNAGDYFNSQTNQCEEDINKLCWTSCRDGEITGSNTSCSLYYSCNNGNWKEEYCNVGYYFNPTTKQCEEDINNSCWSQCQEGETLANAYSCSSYFKCNSGAWKEEFCNEGYYFNSQTNQCVEDINKVCWTSCRNGEISESNTSCSSYFLCISGNWKEEYCNVGYNFNPTTKQCEEDINNSCWSQCHEGETLANAYSCSSYFKCNSGEWKEDFCNEGYYFNSQTNQCEEDINKICWTTCRDGEISGSNTSCSAYFLCSSGNWKEEYCNVGYYFNSKTKQCEEDNSNSCWPKCQKGDTSANAYSCSSYFKCNSGTWKEEFCNEGYYFNSQTNQCVEDINKECWTSCRDGEITGSNTSCSSYFLCSSGNWKEEYCNVGYYFNPTTKQCEEDINNSCWSKCQEGETSANAYSCSSYFKCSNGAWEEEFCNAGDYFNSQTNQCEEDINKVCWTSCRDGEISGSNTSCSSYYSCNNGNWKEEFCNAGAYFNSQTNQCEEDINNVCWTSCQDGEIKESNASCSSYYLCSSGNWREEYCNVGYYFNPTTKQCEEDISNSCWSKCQEGETSANGYSCSSYFKCSNGAWEEEFCNAGDYFNSQTNQCEEDINKVCWTSCQEGDIWESNTSCSSYYSCNNGNWKEEYCNVGYYFNPTTKQCEEDINNSCWSKCQEGETSPNAYSCSSYFKCSNGAWEEEFCNAGDYFNSQTNQCEEDINKVCWTSCRDGEISGSNTSCSSYYSCNNGNWKEEFCNAGDYFNSQTNQCEEDINKVCWTSCRDGEISGSNTSCSSYYSCYNGSWKEEYCNVGYYFNPTTKQCEEDISNSCWPKCQEGETSANAYSCSSYFRCSNGAWEEEFCNAGDYFDSQTNQCEEDINKVCWTICLDGEIIGSNTSCSAYFLCSSGNWKEEYCNVGYYFNSKTKQCEEDNSNSCWPKCQEGDTSANAYSCSSYFKCSSGAWKEEFCNEGYYFNSQTNQCEEDINKVCWTSCQEGEIRESNTSCSSYYSCYNGNWKEEYCNVGYYFNTTTKQCEEDINNSCWSKCQEGETSANAYSCSSYFKCNSGAWKEEFCNEGYYFNSQTNQCEEDINKVCWTSCRDGEITGSNTSCSSYFLCSSGNWKEEYCNVGYYFNPTTKQCEEDINNSCWSKCQEGETSANAYSCSSYFKCNSGVWKEEFCNEGYYFNSQTNQCEEDINKVCWTSCRDGEISGSNTSCSSYFLCSSGNWKEEYCTVGYYFNPTTKQCEEDISNSCWPKCQEGETSANAYSCSSYFRCSNGAWEEEFCNAGDYFDSQTNQCEEDINKVCWTICLDGEIIGSNTSCSAYFLCSSGNWKEEYCNVGYYFNSKTKQCEEDNSNSCWPKCHEGDTSANAYSCSSYFKCNSGAWKEEFCNEGYYFNSQTNQCEEDINKVCWTSCQEGEIRESNTSCSSYYSCYNGNWKEEYCNVGYYFNTTTKQCEEDINNSCWPTCQEGETSANAYSCSSYFRCSNGAWEEEFCNAGDYFDSQTNQCEEDINKVCWTSCRDGEISVSNTSCSSYYSCYNGNWKEEYCNVGYYFNTTTKQCEEDINNSCWPTCQEGETSANAFSCSSYFKCSNGAWEEEFCNAGDYFNSQDNQCVEDINKVCWTSCRDGEISGSNTSCSSYFLCSSGNWKEEYCNVGYYFNPTTKQCEEDNNNSCWPQCQEGETLANAYSCSSYFKCSNGAWEEEFCNTGDYFSSETNQCEEDTDNSCWPLTPTIPTPSTEYDCDAICCDQPNNQPLLGDTCQQFVICIGGQANIFNCPSNLHFNIATGHCDFPENAKCNKPYTPPSGPNAGPSGTHCASGGRCEGKRDGTFFTSNNNTCSSQYVVCQCECEVERTCSSSLMFNIKLGVCDWPANFGC